MELDQDSQRLKDFLIQKGYGSLIDEFAKNAPSTSLGVATSSSSDRMMKEEEEEGEEDNADEGRNTDDSLMQTGDSRGSAAGGEGHHNEFLEDIKLTAKSKNQHIYTSEYSTICSWSLSSLEMIRSEYLSVLFPIFVHSYIQLIKNNYIEEAKAFRAQFQSDHHLYYPSELYELAMLLHPNQLKDSYFLKSNPFLKKSTTMKFVITISEFAYSLLLQFLMQKELKNVILIIQENLTFIRVQTSPDGSYRPFKFENDIDETTKTVKHNFTSIKWGVPGTASAIANSRIFDLVKSKFVFPDTKTDDHYQAWIECIVQAEVLLNKDNLASVSSSGGGSKSSLDPSGENNLSSKSLHKSSKSNPISPSILFASVGNSYDGMICMDINENMSQIVGGFKDNCVRVWRLDEDKNNRKKGRSRNMKDNASSNQDQDNNKTSWFGQLLLSGKRSMSIPMPSISVTRSKDDRSGAVKEAQTSKSASSFGLVEDDEKFPLLQLRGHSRPVHGVHQDKSSRLVLSVSSDETARLWDLHLSQCVCKYRIGSPSWDVKFNPMGYYFATANMDGSAMLFSVDRDVPLRLMVGHLSDVTSLSWSNNANYFVTGSDDKTCRLWDIRTGNCERLFRGCSSAVSATSFSPFGNMVAAGTDIGTIYTWDVGSGAPISIMQGHVGAVNTVSFSSECDAIVSGGSDCTVKIWDVSLMKANIHNALNYSNEILRGSNNIDPVTLSATNTYHTKFTSVYKVKYSPMDLIYAGGPFCKSMTIGFPSLDSNLASASESEAAMSLGISQPIPII